MDVANFALIMLLMTVFAVVCVALLASLWMLVDAGRRSDSTEPRSDHRPSRPSGMQASGGRYSGSAISGRTTSGSATDSTSMWAATDFGGVSTESHYCSSSSISDCSTSSGGGDCGGGGGGCD